MSDCDRVAAALSGDTPLSDTLALHARECAACRKLLAMEANLARPRAGALVPSPALRMALEQDAHAVRRRTPLGRALGPAALTAVLVVGTGLASPRAPVLEASVLASLGALALLVAGGFVMVFHRGRSGLGPPPRLRWAYALGAIAAFAVIALTGATPAPQGAPAGVPTSTLGTQDVAATASNPLDHEGPRGGSSDVGGRASLGLVLTAVLGVALLASARRTVPVAPEASGACAGVCAGLVAAAALHLHCPSDAVNLALGHGVPLVVGALLGAAAGRHVLAP